MEPKHDKKDKDRAVAEEALEEDRYRSEADVHAALHLHG